MPFGQANMYRYDGTTGQVWEVLDAVSWVSEGLGEGVMMVSPPLFVFRDDETCEDRKS